MQSLAVGKVKAEDGEHYGTPKEIWGFRARRAGVAPLEVALAFLGTNAEVLGIADALSTLRHQRTVTSLGARHVIFQQEHAERRVHRAYVTVHIANDGAVYLAKNRAAPAANLPNVRKFEVSHRAAVARARRAVRAKGTITVSGIEQMWFPRGTRLLPAIRVRLRRARPAQDWIVYVHATNGRLLERYDNLALLTGRGTVFDPSPVTALGGHETLLTKKRRARKPPAEAYREVTLRGLSSAGTLDGDRVTTNGTTAKRRLRRPSLDFRVSASQKGFEEVMVYFHVDEVVRYVESLGFRGSRAIFDRPVRVNVNGTREDNSWYSPTDRLLTFGTGDIDDAEDGETIVHELGHALQDAIIPDFGQSEEAAAEGFAECQPRR
jgi:hypothetical protein